jgi:hypothetical protein
MRKAKIQKRGCEANAEERRNDGELTKFCVSAQTSIIGPRVQQNFAAADWSRAFASH